MKIKKSIKNPTSKKSLLPDRTDQKREDLLNRIADIVPGMIVVYNIRTGDYIYINNSVRKILGYSPSKFLKKGINFATSLIHPADLPLITKKNIEALRLANTIKNLKPNFDPIVNFEYRMKHKDGKYRWLHSDGSVFSRNEDGLVKEVMNISVDITERIEKEKAVEAHFRQLADLMPQIVWTASADGMIDYYNKKWYEFTDFNPGNGEGQSWLSILHPDDYDFCLSAWKKSIKTGQVFQVEYRFKDRKTGGFRWYLGRALPIKDKKDQVIKWYGTYTDINDNKELEKRKDEFISIASHELKTPVTIIKGFAQILQSQFEYNQLASKYLSKMDSQIDRLSSLVNDLLDVSRLQSGKLKLNQEFFNINSLIDEIIEDINHSSRHELIFKPPQKSLKIWADKYRISQVLINLISNAIKYSPKAKRVIVKSEKLENNFVQVSVKDYGIGITKSAQLKIFEPFYQADSRIRQSFSGLGLGLHISKEIVERHGGQIWVESKKGLGSIFFFKIPIKKSIILNH